MTDIARWLVQNGYGEIDNSMDLNLQIWEAWYRGKVASFHCYNQYNGKDTIKRIRKSMGMAKTVAEDWANLLLNEKVTINISDEDTNNIVQNVLNRNRFWSSGNQLIEKTFALGTGAFVEFLSSGNVCVDYIRADMIYPLRWENGEIIDCAFASRKNTGEKTIIYLNIHQKLQKGYLVTNKMFETNGQSETATGLTPISLPEGIAEQWVSDSDIPLFQILKPNIANNLQESSAKGISIFANAIDQLEGIDLIYDSYCNEFRLGKKRIIVPLTFAQVEMEESGIACPIFDANDTEFYATQLGGDSADKLQEINMELRSAAHEEALKTALNALSLKCGMGAGRYRFESDTVKTATEVISAKSVLFQNIKKHELLLEEALRGLVAAVMWLSGIRKEVKIDINFDDSIIEDTAAERMRDMQEVREGLMKKWEYRVKWYGEDEETAKAMTVEETPIDIFAD